MEERVLLSFNVGGFVMVLMIHHEIVEFLVPLLTPSTSMLSVNPSIVLFEARLTTMFNTVSG